MIVSVYAMYKEVNYGSKRRIEGSFMTIKEKAELIVKDIKKEQETNPIHIFKNIAKRDYVSIHRPEHHILDDASSLTTFRMQL